MYLSKVHWAAVTSHQKWIFLRRAENPIGLTYSTVELQENSTRPFLSFLAMSLAAEGAITIPHSAKGTGTLSNTNQTQSDTENNSDLSSLRGGVYIPKSKRKSKCSPTRIDPPVTRSKRKAGVGTALQVLCYFSPQKNL